MSLRASLAWLSISSRIATRVLPVAAILVSLVQLSRGAFRPGQPSWFDAAAVVGLLTGIAVCAASAIRRRSSGAPRRPEDELKLGGSLIAAACIVVAATGPLLFPIVYLLVAFLVSFLPPLSGVALLGVAVVFDGAITLGGPGGWSMFATHAIFLLLFAALVNPSARK